MPKLCRKFPFQVALGALLIYGLTLCHGVSLNSLPLAAKIAGWDWIPMVGQPVLWLLTLPLRLLPGAWSPTGLNFFSALGGAVTLGLLARSLELLPWFRPLATLQGWPGRLPWLLAVVACGLEFNFWQDATAATGEILDVLLLAAAVWCGLEYGVAKNLRWLQAAALFWGLGLAENWVMQFTLPLFVLALAWILKRRFLKLKVVLPLAGFGLAGFSVYAWLPLANGLLPGSPWGFGAAWGHSFSESKSLLLGIYGQFWVMNRMVALAVLLFFLLPLVAVLLRSKNEETQNQSQLDRSLTWIFRGVRLGLLLVCVWLVFDPIFGPRQLLARQLSLRLPLLTFDYLNALGIGSLAGNLLLMIQPPDGIRRRRQSSRRLARWLKRATVLALAAVFVLLLLGLGARNLPGIMLANREPLTQFGERMRHSLPPGGGIVVSDFPDKLAVFQAALARHRDKSDWLPVDIEALPAPEYRARWEHLHARRWLAATNPQALGPGEMLSLMERLAQSNRIFYLHPSFGYFFERFYQQPAGLAFELKRLPTNMITPPLLTAEIISQQEQAWDDLTPEIERLQRLNEAARPSWARSGEKWLCLETAVPGQIRLLSAWSSMALDAWGVQLQRNACLPAAQRRFTQAFSLNTNNWAARLNLFCNANLQSGTSMSLENITQLTGEIGSLKNLRLIISQCGPLDEPTACYLLGQAYQQSGLFIQALQQFERAHALAPTALAPDFALAELYARCHLKDRAAAMLGHLHDEIKALPNPNNALAQWAPLEARVNSAQTNGAHSDLTRPPIGQKNSIPAGH